MKPKTFVTIIKYISIFILGFIFIGAVAPILNINIIISSIFWLIVCMCNFELNS
jgi:hypothetical protein